MAATGGVRPARSRAGHPCRQRRTRCPRAEPFAPSHGWSVRPSPVTASIHRRGSRGRASEPPGCSTSGTGRRWCPNRRSRRRALSGADAAVDRAVEIVDGDLELESGVGFKGSGKSPPCPRRCGVGRSVRRGSLTKRFTRTIRATSARSCSSSSPAARSRLPSQPASQHEHDRAAVLAAESPGLGGRQVEGGDRISPGPGPGPVHANRRSCRIIASVGRSVRSRPPTSGADLTASFLGGRYSEPKLLRRS